ncbi:MAG: M48 family metalloprotease [Phycisphaera sp.]|nr:M48 family metalloprotease [Phycisphaera sp.]
MSARQRGHKALFTRPCAAYNPVGSQFTGGPGMRFTSETLSGRGRRDDPASALAWFELRRGQAPRSHTPIVYSLVTWFSAGVLLLLAAAYAAIILGLIWLTGDYVISHLRLLARGASFMSVLWYVIPGLFVLAAVLLMVKPLFRWGKADIEPIELSRANEPLLYEYVDRLCRLLGTPTPHGIKVELSVNAGASMRGWGKNRKLELLLGLPLIAGADLRGLTGILAHELGHFTQGAASRLQISITRMNLWLARVVYERDRFDYWVHRLSSPGYGPIRPVFYAVRGMVSLGRRLLWLFMMMSHAASCVVSRRNEYDADRYMAAVCGSEAVGATLQGVGLLDMALDATYNDLTEGWRHKRLADDLPRLVAARAERMSARNHDLLVRLIQADRTRWLDTHPALVDRVGAARRLNLTALLDDDRPASDLFAAFDNLCRRATRTLYEKRLGDEFKDAHLVSTKQLAAELAANEEAHRALRRYFQGDALLIRPTFPEAGARLPTPSPEHTLGNLHKIRQRVVDAAKTTQEQMQKFGNLTEHDRVLVAAGLLVHAGLAVEPQRIGLRVPVSPHSVRVARKEIAKDLAEVELMLRPEEAAIRRRLTFAMQLLRSDAGRARLADADAMIRRADALLTVCEPFAGVMPKVQDLSRNTTALIVYLQNVDHAASAARTRNAASSTAREIEQLLIDIRGRLDTVAYPFEHHVANVSIGDFVVEKMPAADADDRSGPATVDYLGEIAVTASEALDRIDGTLSRAMAQLAEIAEKVEFVMGLGEGVDKDAPSEPLARLVEEVEKEAGKRRSTGVATGAMAALGQLAAAIAVIFVIGVVAKGVTSAAPRVIADTVPHHRGYQPTSVPRAWVEPTPDRYHPNPYNPNAYNPNAPRPGQPGYNPNAPRPGQPGYNPNDPFGRQNTPYDPRNPNPIQPGQTNRYQPNNPNRYQPNNPTYRPGSPSYRPSSPSYRPSSPGYRPSSPGYRPGSPSPSGPSFPGR